MNTIGSWLFRKQVDDVLSSAGDEKKESTVVDTYEKIEESLSSAFEKAKDVFNTKKCGSGGCKSDPINGSLFWKHHKCLRCNERRVKYGQYCCSHVRT